MGLKNRVLSLFASKRRSTNVNATQGSDIRPATANSQRLSNRSTPPLRRTADFLRRKGKAAGRRVLVKLELAQLSEDDAEADDPNSSETGPIEPGNSRNFDDRYTEIRLLRRGGNGEVHLCRERRIGTLVAVKTIARQSRRPPNEVRILEALGDHRNIVKYYDVLDHPRSELHKKIVFEYCQLGDLSDYSETFEDIIPEMFLWNVLAQLSDGLDHIHQNGVVHGDLKPNNILVVPPTQGEWWPVLKLADFGTSQMYPPRMIPRSHMGTWGYNPPEALTTFGTESDIWSLGVIIHILALGREATSRNFLGETDINMWFDNNIGVVPPGTPLPNDYKRYCYWHAQHPCAPMRIDKGIPHARLLKPSRYSKLLNYFMMRCLDINWRTRISAFELHRFIPVLEGFVLRVMTAGHEDLLDYFNDGRDPDWVHVSEVSDSQVVQQIYFAVSNRARRRASPRMMQLLQGLREIMDARDYADVCRYTGGPVDISITLL